MKSIQNASEYLTRLGVDPSLRGFDLLASAITTVAEDPREYYANRLDPVRIVGDRYGIPASKARKLMTYAIEAAWRSASGEDMQKMFRPTCKDFPPSLLEFICRIAIEIW